MATVPVQLEYAALMKVLAPLKLTTKYVGSRHSCQPTVKLLIVPLVWRFPLGKGYYGARAAAAGICLAFNPFPTITITSMHPFVPQYLAWIMHPMFSRGSI